MVKTRTMVGFALLLLLAGCFDMRSRDPGIEVLPDSLGRVDPASNALGIGGYWYAYGDQYDYPSRCTKVGMHNPGECSRIDTPAALPQIGFDNMGGTMCTAGQVAMVTNCHLTVPGCNKDNPDYSNIWGAGIGLDFGLGLAPDDDPATFVRRPLDRVPWDAEMHRIAGVSFDLNWFRGGVDGKPHMRVEFPFVLPDPTPLPAGKDTLGLDPSVDPPVPATGTLPDHRHPGPPSEEYPSGSPFWELVPSDSWSDNLVSPVREGYNEVRFDSLVPPPEAEKMYYVVNLSQLLGIQFHIPTVKGGPIDYGFCISNLAFFRD